MIFGVQHHKGFTLIELMMIVAIIGILAAIAMVSYQHSTDKAKSVEAEVAVAEINRLETIYYANHGVYSGDLNAIGFSLSPSLKYYRVAVQTQNAGTTFQAMALPLDRSWKQLALVLTHSSDGQISVTKGDPITLAKPIGGPSGPDGNSTDPMGAGGANSGGGGGASKGSCRQGGEATVAADGLLDMNFCLK